jgi:hypothetical protein
MSSMTFVSSWTLLAHFCLNESSSSLARQSPGCLLTLSAFSTTTEVSSSIALAKSLISLIPAQEFIMHVEGQMKTTILIQPTHKQWFSDGPVLKNASLVYISLAQEHINLYNTYQLFLPLQTLHRAALLLHSIVTTML